MNNETRCDYFEPNYSDIEKAHKILEGFSNKTPVLTSRKLNSIISPLG